MLTMIAYMHSVGGEVSVAVARPGEEVTIIAHMLSDRATGLLSMVFSKLSAPLSLPDQPNRPPSTWQMTYVYYEL